MKIEKLELDNFMIFNNLNIAFSPDINVICGENSTGKTAIIKLLYACAKGCTEVRNSKADITKEKTESVLVEKLQGVFRPDKDSVGHLVNRRQGSNRADVCVKFENSTDIKFEFGNRQEKHIELIKYNVEGFQKSSPVYIPPKEIISSTENFASLYADYHIAFEETYYDLARLLERPLRKGPNTNEQNRVMKSFENIVNGSIVQKDKKFYLKIKGAGEFEMGLVSEGYRKLATIMYLILSGSLSPNAVIFWDEPETNMNPKMIKPMVDAIIELARMGVQVFVTTHDYFVQQCFNMVSTYQNKGNRRLQYKFITLYRDNEEIAYEAADDLQGLTHNAIMEEFDALYDREQGFLYGN